MKNIHFKIDEEIWLKLKLYCVYNKTRMYKVVTKLINDFLKNKGKIEKHKCQYQHNYTMQELRGMDEGDMANFEPIEKEVSDE